MRRATGILLLGITLLSACGGGGGRSKDRTRPSITIETPTTASTHVTGSTPVTLGGTAVDDKGIASVTWSNATTAGTGNATGTTTWTADVDLVVGDNDITVTATDVNGRTGTDSITVTLDTSPPIVTITTPTTAPAYQATATPIDLGGTAMGIGNWTATVDLATGLNSITITATDLSGKTGTDRINVTRGIGEAWAWGLDGDGQLGDPAFIASSRPIPVLDPTDPTGFLTAVVGIAGGEFFTVAMK